MRSAWIVLVPITLGVTSAAAQLTADQRARIERSALQRQTQTAAQTEWQGSFMRWRETQEFQERNRRAAAALERRSSSPVSYGIPSGATSRTLEDRATRLDVNLYALTPKGIEPRYLDPASGRRIEVPQRTPLKLTLYSPDGAAGLPLRIEVALTTPSGRIDRTVVEEARPDSLGVYRLLLPDLRVGAYTLSLTTVALDWPIDRRHISEQRVTVRE